MKRFFIPYYFIVLKEINGFMKRQLRYAIGEVLIVIVGITIAFSMNKCSESQKNKTDKEQYLENLKQDIHVDKSNLEHNLAEITAKIETLHHIIPLINTAAPEKLKTQHSLFSTFKLTEFYPKDITYQTMINSGDFKLIDDFTLKAAIEQHYSNYKTILKDYYRQETIHKEYLGEYLIHHANYDRLRNGGFAFENEGLFKNILQSMTGSFQIKKEATERGIQSCDNLLNILDRF